jgi:hypothetical protein
MNISQFCKDVPCEELYKLKNIVPFNDMCVQVVLLCRHAAVATDLYRKVPVLQSVRTAVSIFIAESYSHLAALLVIASCLCRNYQVVQINHKPDATIFQFIILMFIYSSTYFGRFPAHHRELSDCSGSLWFYLCIVVTVVLCSWSGQPDTARLSPRYEGKTRGCHCSHWAPDDGRENARNVMSCKQTSGYSMSSFGWFPGVWFIIADVSEHSICSSFLGRRFEVITSNLLPKKMEQIECSETSAIINQMPGNHPKEDILEPIYTVMLSKQIVHNFT